MMMLSPELSQDGRRDLIIHLLQNADEGQSEFVPAGRYEWTSFKTATGYTIRASIKKRQSGVLLHPCARVRIFICRSAKTSHSECGARRAAEHLVELLHRPHA
jgi:hypothetical protein